MRRTVAAALGLLVAMVGCSKPNERLNAPPHGVAESVNKMQGTFVYMGDSALLADMTVSDMHFLPHREKLNSLGEQRIARLAELMKAYGGTVRLNSDASDEAMLKKRIDAVVAALAEFGVDTKGEIVKADLSGGRGMSAAEAVLIKREEGQYVKGKKSAGNDKEATVGAFGPSGN